MRVSRVDGAGVPLLDMTEHNVIMGFRLAQTGREHEHPGRDGQTTGEHQQQSDQHGGTGVFSGTMGRDSHDARGASPKGTWAP